MAGRCIQKQARVKASNNKLDDLRNSLTAIKSQLIFITKTDDKVAAMKIADELQKQFKTLIGKKYEQTKLIERLKQENESMKAYGADNFADVSQTHRKLCEIIERQNRNCDELQSKCEQLQREKTSYETQCEALSRCVAKLRSSIEQPCHKDYVICELTNTVEVLDKMLCDLSRKSIEERNRLEKKYIEILTRYEVMFDLLQSGAGDKQDGDNIRADDVLETFSDEVKKLLEESQAKSLEEQKELIRESFQLYVHGSGTGSAQADGARFI